MFLLFIAGATAARFDDTRLAAFAKHMPQWIVLGFYLGVTTATAFRVVSEHISIWLYAVAGVLLMIEVCYGGGWLNRLFAWRPIRRIGNISYSLFLVHIIPICFVIMFRPAWLSSRGLVPALLWALVALIGSLILAGALFLIAERPYFAARGGKAHLIASKTAADGEHSELSKDIGPQRHNKHHNLRTRMAILNRPERDIHRRCREAVCQSCIQWRSVKH